MVKAIGEDAIGPILMLGLSDNNIHNLKQNNPIFFDLEILGWKLERCQPGEKGSRVLILCGENEKDIVNLIGFDTPQPKTGEEFHVFFDGNKSN